MSALLLTGDSREVLAAHGPFDMVLADPPYGDTALAWDTKVRGWEAVALSLLKPTGSMWVFGSMRYFLAEGVPAGFRMAQDIVWEKPNGSGFAADRFKRVHEHAVQFYRADAPWAGVFNSVQREPAPPGANKHVRNSRPDRVAHKGSIGAMAYHDDGMRLVRSIIKAGRAPGAIHSTQKPTSLLEVLIRTSCPPGGLVGDFFAGSGAGGEACLLAGRRYVGAEIDPDMADKARARLAGNLFSAAAIDGASDQGL